MTKEEIYETYRPKIYGYIYNKLNNHHDSEDLCMDVFVKVYSNLEAFDEKKSSLSTWIYTITQNTVRDFFRTHRISSELDGLEADDCSVEEEICNEETLELLADALEKLEDYERDIIIFHYYKGITIKDAAEKMHISYTYAKILHTKALVKLKNYIE